MNKQRNPKEPPILSWIITIVLFMVGAWPIALFTLFRILTVGSITSPPKRQNHPYTIYEPIDLEPVDEKKPAKKTTRRQPVRRKGAVPIPKNWGRKLSTIGLILTVIFGIYLFGIVFEILSFLEYGLLSYDIERLLQATGFFAGSLLVFLLGLGRKRKAARYTRYLQLIGQRETVSIPTLAEALPVSCRKACDDLQDMLERNFLPTGYIDRGTKTLILSENGLRDEAPKPQPEPPKEPPKEDENDVLRQIRDLRDNIEDPTMQQKVDRIGEITARILDYQKSHPDSAEELRSFLNYYLPTTLKILRSYEQMEEQRINGENIRTTKAKVEGMMDKVVEGFETRLDKLFHTEAVDITSDVQVLEQMLQQDGLTGEDWKMPKL